MRAKMSDIHKYHAHALNVGLGKQSTATALMCINGDLPRPDCFIFADTGWERQGTYENLERFKPLAEKAGIPFHIVSAGNIRKDQTQLDTERTELPYYCDPSRFETVAGLRELLAKDITKAYHKVIREMKQEGRDELVAVSLDDLLEIGLADFDRRVGTGEIKAGWKQMRVTMLGRQCTQKYKIEPVNKECRKLYGAHFKRPIGTWLGISTDEWTRMATSRVKAFVLFYPLIDYGMSVDDCVQYLIDHDYPVPVKSSCIGCPFHSDELWQDMSDAEISDADDYEKSVNAIIEKSPKLKDKPYFANGVRLHGSMIPIGKRPFNQVIKVEQQDHDGVCGSAGCFL